MYDIYIECSRWTDSEKANCFKSEIQRELKHEATVQMKNIPPTASLIFVLFAFCSTLKWNSMIRKSFEWVYWQLVSLRFFCIDHTHSNDSNWPNICIANMRTSIDFKILVYRWMCIGKLCQRVIKQKDNNEDENQKRFKAHISQPSKQYILM